MSRRLRFALLAALFVVAPFLLWGGHWVNDQLVLHDLRELDPPIPVLAEPTEDPTRPPEAWLLFAFRDRGLFARSVHFCRRHAEHPLPNCRNLLVADEIRRLLPPPFPPEALPDAR